LDAVFVAYSDVVALTVIRELRDQNVDVPAEIAVVGFDNIQMAEYSYPRLTTVDQGLAVGIPILVDKLMRQIAGEAVESQFVDGALVVRESCGARDLHSSIGETRRDSR
jgi:DNA-binding LacI/PurR family transcriptional regulator